MQLPLGLHEEILQMATVILILAYSAQCPILPEVEYIKRLNEKGGNFLTTIYFRNRLRPMDCSLDEKLNPCGIRIGLKVTSLPFLLYPGPQYLVYNVTLSSFCTTFLKSGSNLDTI